MHQNLLDYIVQYTNASITSEEEEVIRQAFQPKKLRKRQYFLQEGGISKHTAFICKGAMRQYSIDEKGNEQIVHLFIENHWATDRESFTMLTPSIYNIDAWEDTDILVITRAEMLGVMKKVPAITEMVRLMDERHAIASQRRLNSTISNTAEKKYEDFTNNYPHFIQRFPQHQIASFLGITKETLSRVRKQSYR